MIAPKKLVVSLAEATLAAKYEIYVETKNPTLKQIEKYPIEGFKCGVISHSIRRQGASISVIIQEFISLLRSIIQPQATHKPSAQYSAMTIESDVSYNKQKSLMIIQQQQENF